MQKIFVFVGLFLFAIHLELGQGLCVYAADATSLLQEIGYSTVDWTHLEIRARGRGEPRREEGSLSSVRAKARQMAEENAFHNLLDSVYELPISERENLESRVNANANLKNLIQRTLRQFEVTNVIFYSDGAMELEIRASLPALLAQVLGITKEMPALSPVSKRGSVVYTGLIVDTQGIVFRPVIAPTLLAEDNLVVYSQDKVKGEAFFKHGGVSYHTSVTNAQKDERVGKNPLVVKALRTDSKDSLVISSKLQKSNANLSFLEEGRVIIVLPSH